MEKKTNKKTTKPTESKTYKKTSIKKEVKTTNTKRKTTKKKTKKGFTLIELLAVIIILGVLMIVAIPAVTSYISNSRKASYINSAKNIVGGARNLVNTGTLGMYDTNVTYYIPVKRIPTENGTRSPYGDFTQAYIGVIYTGRGYEYYWISNDTARQGIPNVTPLSKLENDLVQSDVNDLDIRETVETTGILGRRKIMILDDYGNWESERMAAFNVDSTGQTNEITIEPEAFATDSWSVIAYAVKNNLTSAYHVGDTKQVDLGELGVHTVRITNMSNPSECSTEGFSQTACGFVVEFADIITQHRMNPYTQNGNVNGDGNKGGWEYSEMRQYVNNTIYNSLPEDLKSVIIDTFVVSSYGAKDNANFLTTDKIYLLSKVEVDGVVGSNYTDSQYSRQLDYYNGYSSNRSIALKGDIWCLRSAAKMSGYPQYYNIFYGIRKTDGWVETYGSCDRVSPAFRIG